MTHGKAKAKKTASKASGTQKSSSKAVDSKAKGGGKDVKTVKSGKTGGEKASPKAVEAPKKQQTGGEKTAAPKAGSNGKPKGGRGTGDPSGFSNAEVGAAFKRAIKKFPNAFRKLTD